MPFSTNAGKQFFKQQLDRHPDIQTVIDIGSGSGTYTQYRKPNQKWIALEIWGPYIEQYELKRKYDHVIIGDARYTTLPDGIVLHPTLTIFGDILEHLSVDDAEAVIGRWAGDYVYISSPIGNVPQGAWGGNPYETHLHDFDHDKVLEFLKAYGDVEFEVNKEDPAHDMGCYWVKVRG